MFCIEWLCIELTMRLSVLNTGYKALHDLTPAYISGLILLQNIRSSLSTTHLTCSHIGLL